MTACGTCRAGMVAFLPATVTLPAALLTPAVSTANSLIPLGADVSTVQRALDLGTRCSNTNGTVRGLKLMVDFLHTRNGITSSQLCSAYQVAPAGQTATFTGVRNTARDVGAIGTFYREPTRHAVRDNGWDPADIDNSGNTCENQAVSDRNGCLLPGIRWTTP